MWKLGRRGRAAFVGAAAIAGASVLVGASPSVTAEEPVVVAEPYGTMTLAVANGKATITLTKVDGGVLTETLTAAARCSLPSDKAGDPDLLDFGYPSEVTQFGVGLNVNDIGVRAKNNCATDSGHVVGARVA